MAFGSDTLSALRCAWFAKDDIYLLEFCAALRRNGCFDAEVFHMELNKLIEYNATDATIQAILDYLTHPTDDILARELRTRLTQLGVLLGRNDLTCFDLTLLPRVEDVPSDIGLLTVTNLTHGPHPLDAVEYAYELLRRHYTSPEAHKAMIVSVLWRGKNLKLPEPTLAEAGCAIKYRDNDSERERWHIIEDSPQPSAARLECAPDNALSMQMLGKSEGDIFFLRQDEVQTKTATILAVWSKYKFVFNRCLEEWETNFPDEKWLWGFTFKPERDDNFAPAFRSIDKQAAFVRERENIYESAALSASNFAQMLDVSVMKSVWHLIGSGHLPIRCCMGQQADFYRAESAFDDFKGIILDESAITTIHVSGFIDDLGAVRGPLFISRGTMLQLRQMLTEMESSGGKRLTKAEEEGKYALIEDSEEAIAQRASEFRHFISVLEDRCQVLDGTALAHLAPTVRDELVKYVGRSAAETIALARHNNLVLWTDDLWVALKGVEKCNVGRVWTEWLLVTERHGWQISTKKRLRCLGLLVQCRYLFTRLAPEAFLLTLKDAEWKLDDGRVKPLVEWFTIPEVTDKLVALTAANALILAFQQAPELADAEALSSAIFGRIARRKNAPRVFKLIVRCVQQLFAEDALAARQVQKIASEWARSL